MDIYRDKLPLAAYLCREFMHGYARRCFLQLTRPTKKSREYNPLIIIASNKYIPLK